MITLASLWLAKAFLKPVDRLTDGFRQLARGHQDVVVEAVSNDELGELARSFNHMVKKNKKTSQQQNDKTDIGDSCAIPRRLYGKSQRLLARKPIAISILNRPL